MKESVYELLKVKISERGWQKGYEEYLNSISISEILELRAEISARYTGWELLLSRNSDLPIIVVDYGIGSIEKVFSKNRAQVFSIEIDEITTEIKKKRFEHLNVKNVIFTDLDTLNKSENREYTLVVDLDNDKVSNIVKKLLHFNKTKKLRIKEIFLIATNYKKKIEAFKCFNSLIGMKNGRNIIIEGEKKKPISITVIKLFSMLSLFKLAITLFNRNTIALTFSDNNSIESINGSLKNGYRLKNNYRIYMGKPHGIVFSDSEKKYINRIPLDDFTKSRYETNASAIKDVSKYKELLIPIWIEKKEEDNYVVYRESCLKGSNISTKEILTNGEYITEKSFLFLKQLHNLTARSISSEFASTIILSSLQEAHDIVDIKHGDKKAKEILSIYSDILEKENITVVFSHGDYTVDNIMYDYQSKKITGVFDWDYASPHGLPGTDVVTLFASIEKRYNNNNIVENIMEVAFGESKKKYMKYYDLYTRSLGLSIKHIELSAIVAATNFINTRLFMEESYNEKTLYKGLFSNTLINMHKNV